MYFNLKRHGFAVLVCLSANCLYAQTRAYDPSKYPGMDAGALIRQAEQSHQAGVQQQALSRLTPIDSPLVLPHGVTLRVASFKFLNSNSVKNDSLMAAASPFANRDLNQSDLDNLCSAVADAYRQAGWVVRVYVPRQAIPTDILSVQILETLPPPSVK